MLLAAACLGNLLIASLVAGLVKKKGFETDPSVIQISKAKKNYEVLVEFGTISDISSALSANYLTHLLVVENQITFFGPKEKLDKVRIKIKKAYYPQEILYKMFISRQVNKIGKRLLKIYN